MARRYRLDMHWEFGATDDLDAKELARSIVDDVLTYCEVPTPRLRLRRLHEHEPPRTVSLAIRKGET